MIEYKCFKFAECPEILSPAEVVVKFGDPLFIMCNTSAPGVEQVELNVSFGAMQTVGPLSVIWTADEVKEWDVKAKCSVTLENDECIQMTNITVYSEYKTTDFSAS